MGVQYMSTNTRHFIDNLETYIEKAFDDITQEDLKQIVVSYFTNLWRNGIKSFRTASAVEIFGDLTEEEIVKLIRADAFTNALDDIIDIQDIGETRGKLSSVLYSRAIISAVQSSDTLFSKYVEHGGKFVFDIEWYFRKNLDKLYNNPEQTLYYVYSSIAYDMWYFIALPVYKRLPKQEADIVIKAGLLYRALWLIRDHIEDLEEDKKLNVYTPVRLVMENVGKRPLLNVVDRIYHEVTQLYSNMQSKNARTYLTRIKNLAEKEYNLAKNLLESI